MIKQSATSSSTWRDCGNSTLSTLTPDFSQFKMYFHLKREQLSNSLVLLAHVKHFIWFVFGGLILGTWQQRDGGSWCTYTSSNPLLVKVSQVLESTFSNNPLRAAVIPVACAPFPLPVIFPLISSVAALWRVRLLWLTLLVESVDGRHVNSSVYSQLKYFNDPNNLISV